MPPDVEHANERTKLLPDGLVNDRRLNAIQHEDEASSVIASYVSKEEQALASAAVGERLPYNDYTTIDWLHDLVRCPQYASGRDWRLMPSRSKTRTATASSIRERGSATASLPSSKHARDGLLPPSSAY